MKRLKTSMIAVDWITKLLFSIAGLLLLWTMVITCTDVVMRYFFNRPIFWATEITEYCLLYITFLGTAWVLKEEAHVKIDILINQLNPFVRSLMNRTTSFLGVVTTSILFWYSAKVTLDNFREHVYTPRNLELPFFVILAIIPVGYLLLIIEFLRQAFGKSDKREGGAG